MPSFQTLRDWPRPRSLTYLTLALSAACMLAAQPSRASLGKPYASVVADRARLSARMASTSAGAYAVHTLSLANGGVVREYAGVDGVVFAVAWRAPGRPDLQQLLGDGFATLQADNARGDGPRLRRPLSVQRDSLVVRSGGHPGGFWGLAYLPQQLPAGVSPRDLK